MGTSVYTERSNREQYSEETVTSITGFGLSRARLADGFSTYSRFAHRAFPDRNDRPFRMFRALKGRYSSFAGVTRDKPGIYDELLFVPVIVVDVGAVQALDHLGSATAGFDGLEDAEGDERATAFVVQSVRVDDEGDVGEGFGEAEGVHADLPDVVPPADVKGGVVACHVAPVSTSVSSKEMSRMRALQSTMQSSQVPEVTSLRYSLPTCVMHARIRVCAPRAPCYVAVASLASCCISVASPAPKSVTCASFMSSPSLSSSFWVADQDMAEILGSARTNTGPLAHHPYRVSQSLSSQHNHGDS